MNIDRTIDSISARAANARSTAITSIAAHSSYPSGSSVRERCSRAGLAGASSWPLTLTAGAAIAAIPPVTSVSGKARIASGTAIATCAASAARARDSAGAATAPAG
jgi:hypothetical protein